MLTRPIEIIRLFVVFGTLALVGFACNSGNGTQDDPNDQAGGTRWSDTGDYNYDMPDGDCDTGSQYFTSQRDYCLGLENDELNNDCALDARAEAYAGECGDDFQENNAPVEIVQPEPQPEPAPVVSSRPNPPTPTPTPMPSDDSTNVQVVRDLKAAEITVDVAPPTYDIPGEPSARDYLPAFWDTLLSVEYQILNRKDLISSVTVGTYVAYTPLVKSLTLDGAMTTSDLNQFFALFDRLQKIENATGVSIDMSIMLFDSKPKSFDALNSQIMALEKYVPTLLPAVKKIEFGLDKYNNFQIDTRELTVSYDTCETDFAHYASELSGAQPFYKMLDDLSISISDSVFGFDKDLLNFNVAVSVLLSEKSALTTLAKAGTLNAISISDETHFYPSIKEISIATSGPSAPASAKVLEALAWQTKFTQATKVTFDYPTVSLDAKFVQSNQNLIQVADLVRAHPAGIQNIMFGAKSQIMATSLVVGSDDSIDDLKKVIQGAK